jgi:hypothetical protein
MPIPGNTTGGSFTVPLTSCLTCLDYSVLQIKTKIVSSHAADSKQVKTGGQQYSDTSPPLVFPAYTFKCSLGAKMTALGSSE